MSHQYKPASNDVTKIWSEKSKKKRKLGNSENSQTDKSLNVNKAYAKIKDSGNSKATFGAKCKHK